jgi:hypothetical protein
LRTGFKLVPGRRWQPLIGTGACSIFYQKEWLVYPLGMPVTYLKQR